MKKNRWAIVGAIGGVALVGLAIGLGFGLCCGSSDDEILVPSNCIDKVNSKCFSKAAVAADDDRCSIIGADMMRKGGSAVDALIATLACDGVVNPYHSGIGGATFVMVYDPSKNNEPVYIDCRETAPAAATEDMFGDDPLNSQDGPLSIAIPGEVKCFKEAHDLFGTLPWKDVFQPAIKLAREGWEIYNHTAIVIQKKVKLLGLLFPGYVKRCNFMSIHYSWSFVLDIYKI